MAFQYRTNERMALVGATGTGKTFFARRLLAHVPRLIVIDPKSTLRDYVPRPYDKRARKRLENGEPFRARFAPAPGEDWRYEEIFEQIYWAGNVVVYIDEVYAVSPPGRQPGPYLTALYTRGRELGIGVVAATQRPAWVPLFILSEANSYVMFRLMLDKDKRRMAEFMGREVLGDIPDPYGFWLYQTSWASQNKPAAYYRSVV
jgi:DNA helicase HerA-like ATPase